MKIDLSEGLNYREVKPSYVFKSTLCLVCRYRCHSHPFVDAKTLHSSVMITGKANRANVNFFPTQRYGNTQQSKEY